MNSLNEITKRLIEARSACGLTQRAVAAQLNVTIGTIQAYEYGRAKLTLTRAMQLADLYKVSLDWIAFGSDRMNRDPRIDRIKALLNEETPPA